jgi:Uma2 family endonuclease
MATKPRLLAPDDVVDLLRADGVRGHELIDGSVLELHNATPANRQHQSRILRLIAEHVIAQRLTGMVLGDVALVLSLPRDPQRMRIADIAYVERSDIDNFREPECALRAVPDMVVVFELDDRGERILDFQEAGARVFWALDAQHRRALVYNRGKGARQLLEDDMIDAAPVMPGLRMRVGDLFRLS